MFPVWSTRDTHTHRISKGNVVLCCNDMHPLLLEFYLISIKSIRMIVKAYDIIFELLMVNTVSFLPKEHSNFKQNNEF